MHIDEEGATVTVEVSQVIVSTPVPTFPSSMQRDSCPIHHAVPTYHWTARRSQNAVLSTTNSHH